jgi:hypothetical protein
MTEAAKRRTRWSKGRVRTLAWGTGGAAFIMAAAPLVAAPKPPTDTAAGHTAKQAPARQVIERHITRKVIIVDPVPTTPVYSGGSSGSYSGGSSSSSGGSQISANPAPPPPPPATTSGGS